MTLLRATLPGAALLAGAAAVLLWPLSESGASGNALRPDYSGFGWFAYGNLPPNPTDDELRAAGVVLPRDVVAQRRRVAGATAAAGVAVAAAGAVLAHRRRLG